MYHWYENEIVGMYLQLRCAVAGFTCVFSRSLTPFLKGENRYALILSRELIEGMLLIILLIALYTGFENMRYSLTAAGIAYITANSIIAIWMFIIIMKISFLGTEYQSVARF